MINNCIETLPNNYVSQKRRKFQKISIFKKCNNDSIEPNFVVNGTLNISKTKMSKELPSV